jgi:probable F420-dependent oxidoreductase
VSAPAAQLSIALPTFAAEAPTGWQRLFDTARAADEAGVDRVVMSDHIVFGEQLQEYARPEIGGVRGGVQPTGPDGHWLEPMTTLSVLAGMTRRVRLGTNILVAALRRPAVLAASAATLDVLSGGRLDIGIGTGWQKAEYDAAGLDFEARGTLLDHTIRVCRVLWREQRADYADEHLSFAAIHTMPKPLQPGGVPIWVSGRLTQRTVRRLAEYGAGWIPWDLPADRFAGAVEEMRSRVADAGGDPAGLGVVASIRPVPDAAGKLDVTATMDPVPTLVAAGATDLRIGTLRLPAGESAMTDALAPVVSAFRAAAGDPRP